MDNTNNVNDMIGKLAALSKEMTDVLQDPFFDSWALSKKLKMERKLNEGSFGKIETVYLGTHLQHARPLNGNRRFVHLDADFLLNPPQDIPKNSMFLLLNNDIAPHLPQYMEFYNNNPDVLFVVWDWDSQHWIQMSSILALNSDFYISASSENAFLLGHFNPYVIGPVFAAAHQWTRKFLIEHVDLFLSERLDTPFGMHVFYEKYPKRNRAIATVTRVYPTVGFANNDFKKRSDLENFKEWAQHKTHWIMPVLGGVPIRIYNALVTGGIPILPSFYKNLPEIAVLGKTPFYYETGDLLEPTLINEAAVAAFDAGGESGLVQRISEALQNHHVDTRCEHIFGAVEDAVTKIVERDRSYQLGYLGARG
jgi:hypothetical protein